MTLHTVCRSAELAKCTVRDLFRVRLGLGFVSGLGLELRLRSGLGLEFADCSCWILTLCSAFCKLCRLTNHVYNSDTSYSRLMSERVCEVAAGVL